MTQINVNTQPLPYAVICHRGAIERVGELVSGLHEYSRAFLVSSARVWKHWGKPLQASFDGVGSAEQILFDDRETSKTLRTVERLCRALVRKGADRRSLIVALGGGVVGDVAGFVAASYQRGIRIVHVPTTLVAQVDSAIGGKTGVNLPEGKNLVGDFHQPRLVVADPQTLDTLSARQYRSGIYEVIKYGAIGDVELFERLEKDIAALAERNGELLDGVIPRCVSAKADIVEADERETSGRREVLNFGHTFAHALETATKYKVFLHGEAVGWGMCAAARLSAELGLCERTEAARLENLIRRAGRIPAVRRVTGEQLLAGMRSDKKARGGRIRFVLLRRTGMVEAHSDVPDNTVLAVLRQLLTEGK